MKTVKYLQKEMLNLNMDKKAAIREIFPASIASLTPDCMKRMMELIKGSGADDQRLLGLVLARDLEAPDAARALVQMTPEAKRALMDLEQALFDAAAIPQESFCVLMPEGLSVPAAG